MQNPDSQPGKPRAPENRVPRKDWDRTPWNRWSFQHIREILPTTEVWRGKGPVWDLPRAANDLANLPFVNDAGENTTVDHWLDGDFTDGFIVLHKGAIVFERYLNHMSERSLHLSQSVAKSITASVAGILVGRGFLNPDELITRYLPELEATAWKGATLQHVLDMATGVKFTEDYTAPDSDMAHLDVASGWKPAPASGKRFACVWDQILSLKEKECEHGSRFQYRSIETDVLAHAMERVSGMRLADLISRELWSKLGAEESACFTVDAAGYAMADGGFNATLRDYARFGQMMLDQGMANGQQIVPREWVQATSRGNHALWGEPYSFTCPEGAYRNQFWLESPSRRTIMARGVFGQLIYIAPDDQMVAVKLSSWPEFLSPQRNRTMLSALNSIATHLNGYHAS